MLPSAVGHSPSVTMASSILGIRFLTLKCGDAVVVKAHGVSPDMSPVDLREGIQNQDSGFRV